jgi:hypothetical protein
MYHVVGLIKLLTYANERYISRLVALSGEEGYY